MTASTATATASLQLVDRSRAATLTVVPCIHSSHLSLFKVGLNSQKWAKKDTSMRLAPTTTTTSTSTRYVITRCSGNSNSNDDNSSAKPKAPFGYSRKDVLLIGLGVTLFGVALKSGLEYAGVDPLQAGNVVQLLVVLGMTVGWISTYMFRVASKDMTYAQQLRDYENKVMEKRLEGLTEAELQVLLEQVEEEKRGVVNGEQVN